MKRRIAVVALLASGLSAACGGIANSFARPGFGAVIRYESVPGTTEKYGINAVTDQGKRLFGPAALPPPEKIGQGGGTSSYGGMDVPRWVRVTWRTPIHGKKFIPSIGNVIDTLDFGEIVGDYKVEIASRIPAEVLRYASRGRGRAIYLVFRIKDDGVLLSWSVQESYGGLWSYSLHGGDFPCDPISPHATRPTCTSGYLKDAPWYHP